jgi:aspartate/methionine/tyrosine aminotransferase
MNPFAAELNEVLDETSVGKLLSALGRRMYFPRGILSQSAEADEKAYRFNATIGMAYERGEPLMLDAVREELPKLSREEAVAYAPTAGVRALRDAWRIHLERKNPSLSGKAISLPAVVPGLTAGISYTMDLFMDEGGKLVIPDLSWPNYKLIVEERRQASIVTYPTFDQSGGFNVRGMVDALVRSTAETGRACLILNFPNNPTGYSPTKSEAKAIVDELVRIAASAPVLVVCDDAYFGLAYEPDALDESLFALLCDAHHNLLAVKVDGPTKEDYVWGFRSGFVTFGGKGLEPVHYEAVGKKLMGVIRSSVSSSGAPTQHVLLRAMLADNYLAQKQEFRDDLERRYRATKRYLAGAEPIPGFVALPFNSGYFMTFQCKGFSAEALRQRLLAERGIGTVSIQEKYLRVAFSSVDEEDIAELYREIHALAAELSLAAEKDGDA